MNNRSRIYAVEHGDPGDYAQALELLPDSLDRSLVERIQILLDRANRESHLAVRLREKLRDVAGADVASSI